MRDLDFSFDKTKRSSTLRMREFDFDFNVGTDGKVARDSLSKLFFFFEGRGAFL